MAMTTKKNIAPVVIETSSAHTCELRGKRALTLLRRAGAPAMYDYRPPSNGSPCWTTSAKALADVVAAAEIYRIWIVVQHRQEALPI